MSLSSIMSGADTEPSAPTPHRPSSKASTAPPPAEYTPPVAALPNVELPSTDSVGKIAKANAYPLTNGTSAQLPRPPVQIQQPDERDVEIEVAKIEAMDLSDVESTGWEAQREEYRQRGLKRALAIELAESGKRKVWVI